MSKGLMRRDSVMQFLAALLLLALLLVLPSVAWAQSYTSHVRYDELGREVGTISPDPDGGGVLRHLATRTTYDARGNVIRVETGTIDSVPPVDTDPASWSGFTIYNRVDTEYDIMNRKTRETMRGSNNAVYGITDYSYDTVGRLQCTTVRMRFTSLPSNACTPSAGGGDGPDRITRNVYDAADQLLQIRKGVGTSLEQAYATYDYTLNGQQRTVIDANGNRARLEYDGHDRLERWRFPSKTKPSNYNDASHASALSSAGAVSSNDYEQYSHDANGNRLTLRKRDGRTISYQYDDLNRMTAKIIPNGSGLASTHTRNVYYGYDLRGLQTYARFDSHGGGDGIQTSYDGFGRVASSNNTMGGWNKTLSYRYDRNSNRTRITHADGNYFTTSYDQLDRQFDTNENGGNRISAYRYHVRGQLNYNYHASGLYDPRGYDAAGRLSWLRLITPPTANGDVIFNFGYNPAGQIKSRTLNNDNYANTAHYDVNRAYQVNGLNQYTSAGAASFTHDANGNLTSDGSVTFIYDVENRLVQAMGAKQATLTYDPMGRLWEVNPGTGAANITRFLYDGDALVAEYDAPGNVTDRYVHGVGADVPTQWYEGSAVNSSTRRHLFANWQGSIALITDASGNTVNINAYDAYGIANETNIGRFQYTGQIAIPELGLYHYKARVYSPTLGRFLQTDPIGYEDQVNLYAYVGNDPVNLVDPTGEQRAIPRVPVLIPGAPNPNDINDNGVHDAQDAVQGVGELINDYIVQPIQDAWDNIFNNDEPDIDPGAAGEVPDLTGESMPDAEGILDEGGFEDKGSTKGGYRKFYHPDGSRVHIGPDGRVVRTGPKVQNPNPNGKGYRPRVNQNGEVMDPDDPHVTGESVEREP